MCPRIRLRFPHGEPWPSDRRNQAIPALGNRLDDPWVLRLVTEQSSQFGYGTREHVVADSGVGPDGGDEALLRHDVAGVLGQAHQHLHHLGLEPSAAGRTRHPVEGRLYLVRLTNAEGVGHETSRPAGGPRRDGSYLRRSPYSTRVGGWVQAGAESG
jgi:hypothetical protein